MLSAKTKIFDLLQVKDEIGYTKTVGAIQSLYDADRLDFDAAMVLIDALNDDYAMTHDVENRFSLK